jgi:outer membrane protein assembly factor BamB
VWSSNIPGCFSPAFGGNSTVFVANSNTLRSVETGSATTDWTYTFPEGENVSSPPMADSGIILIGTTVGSVYSFDQASGNIIWVYKTGTNTPVYSAPNYTWNNRVVFACGSNIFNIDYDRVQPYDRTRTYTSLCGDVASSFATAFDPSGNMWNYYTTTSNVLYGVSMLDNSGNYLGWYSAPLAGSDQITAGFTPTMDPSYAYATSRRGRVMRYSAFPSGLVQNTLVQKTFVNDYLIPTTIISAPSVITTASNQLVVFDDRARAYIFQ